MHMKLRLGQPVHATDGAFGQLADIVVDPTAAAVTHIVVSPAKQHQQARLVPIWLVTVDNGIVNVALTAPYVRQLQRVAFDDFVRADAAVGVTGPWDIGSEDLIARPYLDIEDLPTGETRALTDVTQMKKSDCEIRRRSEVTTSDLHLVGHVEGFIASDGHLVGCVVQIGLPGQRHHKIVPMDAVEQVYDREIILTLSNEEFTALPRSSGIAVPGSSPLEVIDLRTKRIADALRDSASRLAARTRQRYRRAETESDRDQAVRDHYAAHIPSLGAR